jgi:hypothetical protein
MWVPKIYSGLHCSSHAIVLIGKVRCFKNVKRITYRIGNKYEFLDSYQNTHFIRMLLNWRLLYFSAMSESTAFIFDNHICSQNPVQKADDFEDCSHYIWWRDLLSEMHLVEPWKWAMPTTITNCFVKSGFSTDHISSNCETCWRHRRTGTAYSLLVDLRSTKYVTAHETPGVSTFDLVGRIKRS